ncbi:MAG: nucleotidyltransferase domain-containing protein [Anaerolineales bacterium]|nr:nucleotidyltransferase domain-containing protein [Anaerolineales bacterium]
MAEISVVVEQTLKDYLNDLAKYYRLDYVILFGSVARGAAKPDSDIDLAIFSADATDENRLQIMADCWLKTLPYPLDIQPVVYSLADYYGDNDFIQKEIIAGGIELPFPKGVPDARR